MVISGVAHLQGGWPAAVFYHLKHPIPYAFAIHSLSGRLPTVHANIAPDFAKKYDVEGYPDHAINVFTSHIFTTSQLLNFTSSRLHVFTSSRLQVFTSSHLHVSTNSRLHDLTAEKLTKT
jgi:hypothetical protein